MKYRIIRSNRKSIGLQVTGDGDVIVRAPLRISDKEIFRFVEKNTEWIEKTVKRVLEKKAAEKDVVPLSAEELNDLAQKALKVIPERVRYYAEKMGVTYGKITIRNQRTRWGSCSKIGNLNFNCLLMLAPQEVIDSVVVHELAHRREMNHSSRFYNEILKVFPDYRIWDKWLKQNGGSIMQRMLSMKK
jgi:hypothetical protein